MKTTRVTRFCLLGAAVGAAAIVPAARAANILDTTATPLYHLNASSGITTDANGVNSWADANANGVAFAQATTTKEPAFSASSPNFNSHPVVTFSGSLTGNSNGSAPNASRLVNSSSTTGVQTVVIIGRTTVFNSLAGVWGINNADTGIRMQSATTWQVQGSGGNGGNGNDFPTSMNINGNNTPSVPLNTPFVMVAEGGPLTLSSTGLGEYFQVGSNTPRPWGGDIAEMAVYNTSLSAARSAPSTTTHSPLTASRPSRPRSASWASACSDCSAAGAATPDRRYTSCTQRAVAWGPAAARASGAGRYCFTG